MDDSSNGLRFLESLNVTLAKVTGKSTPGHSPFISAQLKVKNLSVSSSLSSSSTSSLSESRMLSEIKDVKIWSSIFIGIKALES